MSDLLSWNRLMHTSTLQSTTVTAMILTCMAAPASAQMHPDDLVWHSPSEDSSGSMPLGNGDLGANVWVEPNGDLVFYLSKTDAWSENARLLKLGRVRVALTPNVLAEKRPFSQTLRVRDGMITVVVGEPDSRTMLTLFADANHPVLRIIGTSDVPVETSVKFETWRKRRRELSEKEMFSAYGLKGSPDPVFVEPDTICAHTKNRIVWYHRNERSIWRQNLELQALGDLAHKLTDPLLHRTFGGAITGTTRLDATGSEVTRPFEGVDDTTLRSTGRVCAFEVAVFPLTAQTDTAEQWKRQLSARIDRVRQLNRYEALAAHRQWWHAFWDRSWIHVSGPPETAAVTRGYALQRFVQACAGRGAQPIKFNGSIFTVDAEDYGRQFDADYRRWGGPYWWQNTRLMYWNMLASGDFDLMQPLFRMYLDALPLAKSRTREYYDHGGAFYPETIYFWGTYVNDNYGWERAGKPDGLTDNRYIRYYWQGGLELTSMMLDYYAITLEQEFLNQSILPLAGAIITFYDEHYDRDDSGKLRIWPAQALETFWDVPNPAPVIAGLTHVLNRLLQLPDALTTAAQRDQWRRLLGELPELPTCEVDGETILAPAAKFDKKSNIENPELYAVWPYRLFDITSDDLELTLRTFAHRLHKDSPGWGQDAIQAAQLGLAEKAAKEVVRRFSTHHPGSRFPAFWGPNYDWIPDQDHGGVAMIALQRMLMQADGDRILLLPAWPKEWNVDFKLHAPQRTTVEGIYRGGNVERLKVTPTDRAANVVTLTPQ